MTTEAAMIPLSAVTMVEENEKLTTNLYERLLDAGHSRVPVYSGLRHLHNIRGYVLVKDFIVATPDKEETVRSATDKRYQGGNVKSKTPNSP